MLICISHPLQLNIYQKRANIYYLPLHSFISEFFENLVMEQECIAPSCPTIHNIFCLDQEREQQRTQKVDQRDDSGGQVLEQHEQGLLQGRAGVSVGWRPPEAPRSSAPPKIQL